MADLYRLQRFVEAQNPVYEHVLDELRRGAKAGHWMWFVFPQILGLGHSEMAQRYGISSLQEARAYLDHPVLGQRLQECTSLLLQVNGKTLSQILGSPDNLKFKSSMTLFAQVAPANSIFKEALDRYCNGEEDSRTLERL